MACHVFVILFDSRLGEEFKRRNSKHREKVTIERASYGYMRMEVMHRTGSGHPT